MRVRAPNGEIVEFPDGTSDEVIARAMASEYGAPQQQARVRRPPGYTEAGGFGANLAHGLTLGANDEITGGLSALGAGFGALARGRNPVPAAVQGYRQGADQTRAFRDQFLRERPLAGNFTQGTGAALPIVATMGTSSLPQAAARAPNMLTRMGQGAAMGGVFGAAQGFNSADGDLQERVQGASEGGAVGAALGAVVPPAAAALGAVARPVANTVMNAARRLPTPAPNTLGSNFGNLRAVPPMPPPGPSLPRAAAGTIARLADRARLSPDDVERALEGARARPEGQVLADVFNDPGVRTARAIAQGPGQTGERAATVARNRFDEAPQRIIKTLNQGLRVGESRAQAVSRLENAYRDLSANSYSPLWRTPLGPEQRVLYEQRIAPLLDPQNPNPEIRRIMQAAMRKAERQFNLDRGVGRVDGQIDDHLGRYLHYIKMELGEQARFEASPLRGASGNRVGALRQLYRQFGDLLDPGGDQPAIIPGYRQITQTAGDNFTAQEALESGAKWLRMNAEEVAAQRAAMSPFELYHARVSLADEIKHTTAGNVVGQKNVANALNNRDTQDAIAAAFDTPEQAADFLSTVNTQNELMRNAAQWLGGSQTYSNAMHGADEALNVALDMGGRAASGDLAGAARRGVGSAVNAITMGQLERANNQRGEALLTRVDTPDSQSFARAVVEELRRRERVRQTNAATGRGGAAAVGAQFGDRKRGRPSR